MKPSRLQKVMGVLILADGALATIALLGVIVVGWRQFSFLILGYLLWPILMMFDGHALITDPDELFRRWKFSGGGVLEAVIWFAVGAAGTVMLLAAILLERWTLKQYLIIVMGLLVTVGLAARSYYATFLPYLEDRDR